MIRLPVQALAAALAAITLIPSIAQASAEGASHPVLVRLFSDAERITPGESIRIGVHFVLEPQWHVYWRNPGQGAAATVVEWAGVGLDLAPLQWPAPQAFQEADGLITTYGYASEVVLFANAAIHPTAQGHASVHAEVSYLVCKVDCIPGHAELALTLPVGTSSQAANHDDLELLQRFAAQVPNPDHSHITSELVLGQSAIRPHDVFAAVLLVTVCPSAPKAENAHRCPSLLSETQLAALEPIALASTFIPQKFDGIEFTATSITAHPTAFSGLAIHLEGIAGPKLGVGFMPLVAVVPMEHLGGFSQPLEIHSRVPLAAANTAVAPVSHPALLMARGATAASAQSAPQLPLFALWQVILLALAGGLILNLMPCVLPVLGLKVEAILRVSHHPKMLRQHAVAYAAGVILSMLALAVVVIALQAAGHQVGWGFLLQQPSFVAAISGLLLLFALNLFNVFHINLGIGVGANAVAHAHGHGRSFLEGVLAVIVATPCSAPFLGTAVGFALLGSKLTILLVFACIGLGLAMPVLVLPFVPGWRHVLPKPGAWMEQLRGFLAFSLLATTVWLVWVFGRGLGVDATVALLFALVLLALCAWYFGVQQRQRAGEKRFWLKPLVLTMLLAGAFTFAVHTKSRPEPSTSVAWHTYSKERLHTELAQGNVVFVDFTADWCITCKVNENLVIQSGTVATLARKLGVVMLKADWTDGNEMIRAELARFGKAGVPLYLVYHPSDPENPEVLPELLTQDTIIQALQRAAANPSAL